MSTAAAAAAATASADDDWGVQWRRQNVIVLAARSGSRLVRKGFRSLVPYSGRERGTETEKIGGSLSSSPPLALLSGAAHSYRFKFHQFIGQRERERKRCLPVFHYDSLSLFLSSHHTQLWWQIVRSSPNFFPKYSSLQKFLLP